MKGIPKHGHKAAQTFPPRARPLFIREREPFLIGMRRSGINLRVSMDLVAVYECFRIVIDRNRPVH